jgi:hypothetical protein
MVTHPLAGVVGGGHQSDVGGEPVGAREGTDLTYGHQGIGPEDSSPCLVG